MNTPAKKVLGVQVDQGLDMSWQGALGAQKANCILGYIQSSVGSTVKKGILPFCSAETSPAVLWGPQHKKDMDLLD